MLPQPRERDSTDHWAAAAGTHHYPEKPTKQESPTGDTFASLKVYQTRHPRCDERVNLRECPLIRAAQFLYDTCPGLPTSR
jgi:hypothetical protein